MQERKAWRTNGFVALIISLLSFAGAVGSFIASDDGSGSLNVWLIGLGIVLAVIFVIGVFSLTVVQPNESKVIIFFGKYMGTIRDSGFWMVIPFASRKTVSLKVRNFNSQKLKVNDAEGNPVEIAAVIVFKVTETAHASFNVDDYEEFVEIQSETAIRHIAAQYPYDTYSDNQRFSLRGNADDVASELLKDLQSRLDFAGLQIIETRLTHLAYAQEIASAMLQRQQATAIVSARQKIVEGAVGMVELALNKLDEKGIVLDAERRAVMANNLMVAIVSDKGAIPVINTGTLYS